MEGAKKNVEKVLDYPTQVVLIVDDTNLMRAMHKKYLMELGFHEDNLYQAENGLLGFKKLEIN